MFNKQFTRLLACLVLLAACAPLMAYIGPGAGIPVLGSLIGIIVAVVLALAAIVAWPVRRMLKNRRQKSSTSTEKQESDAL